MMKMIPSPCPAPRTPCAVASPYLLGGLHTLVDKEATGNSNGRNSRDSGISVVSIRDMRLRDVAGCYTMGMELFAFNSAYLRTYDRFVVLEEYASDPDFCLVAEHEGRVVGFVVGLTIIKEVTMGYISWVTVIPGYQRQGIATRLMQQVEERMQQHHIVEVLVETPVSNSKALAFLTKLGYGSPELQVYLSRTLPTLKESEKESPLLGSSSLSSGLNSPVLLLSSSSASLLCPSPRALGREHDQVHIRLMEIQDIWPVYELGTRIFTEQARNLYRFWDETAVTTAYEMDGELALVAESEGRVVGFALGSALEKEDATYGYLIWLAVCPQAHNAGIGRRLYAAYEGRLRAEYPEVQTVMIDTQASNAGALRFFARYHYQLTDTFVYVCKSLSPPSGPHKRRRLLPREGEGKGDPTKEEGTGTHQNLSSNANADDLHLSSSPRHYRSQPTR